MTYLNGNFQLSMEMLEARFESDSILFQSVWNEYHLNGYPAAMKQLAQNHEKYDYKGAVLLAILYNRAGMVDDALRVLEEGYKNHDPNMPYAFVPVELQNLESDPRYIDIAEKMKLPL